MDFISRVKKIVPPTKKQGLTKVQEAISKQAVGLNDNCPCQEVCKKLGTFKQGACFLGTADTHKCMVTNDLLLAKIAGMSA